MKKSPFSEEQIIGILREGRGGGGTVKAVWAKHNVSEQTYYGWKRRYGGMEVDEVRRVRALEEECGRLKRVVADQAVQIQILKEVNAKKTCPERSRMDGKPDEPASGRKELCGRRAWAALPKACRALGLAPSSYYRGSGVSAQSLEKKRRIQDLSERHPRCG